MGIRATDSSRDETARYYYEEALHYFHLLNDLPVFARVLYLLGRTLHNLGNYDKARHYFEKAFELYTNVLNDKDIHASAWFYHIYGVFLTEQGELSKARSCLLQGLRIFRQVEDNTGIGWSLQYLGKLLFYREKDCSAQCYLNVARQEFGNNRKGVAWSAHYLGQIALRKRDYELARRYFQETLKIHQDRNNMPDTAYALDAFAQLAVAEEHWPQSVHLFAVAETLRTQGRLLLSPIEQAYHDRYVAVVRAHMDEATFSEVWSIGQSLLPEQAIAAVLNRN